MTRPAILYVTVDGILKPLAYSQVCRVLYGLTRRGFHYGLLSLESQADLDDGARVARLQSELNAHGITWRFHAYDQAGTSLSAARNLGRLAESARSWVATGTVALLHARGYHAALVAAGIQHAYGVPYLFDARGRWVDERLAAGRWFKRRPVERAARIVERHLYGQAQAIVVLTRLHAQDIVAGDFGDYSGAPIRVITTCADFESFTLEARVHRASHGSEVPDEIQQRLAGKFVLAFIGSTNASYNYGASFDLALRVLKKRSDAHLLILTSQLTEFTAMVREAGVAHERFTIATAPHQAMPDWLSRIDWAIQLLNSGTAKRGSMPTKLAEFFAAGVRPVHFGCNEEVTEWVQEAGTGYVLPTLTAEHLDDAADFIATATSESGALLAARERTRCHFDLAHGLDEYQALLARLPPARQQNH
jgi:Glycosyl transferase 4-like domain